jgi:uncharacterized protein
MKPYFAVQLCCYADMLEALQGRRPEHIGIILGNGDRKPLRTDDCWFYYQAIKRSFLEQQNLFQANQPPLFPGLADYRHWNGHVTKLLESRNDVSLVANIRQAQIEKLATAEIRTVKDLAESNANTVPKMAQTTLQRLRSQARVQIESIGGGPPVYEVLSIVPDSPRLGFGLLPPSSLTDVYFDIEGYPLVEGGLEYLLGVTYQENGNLLFKDWWAHNRTEERASFENLVDWVYARWKRDPSMHIYHYASYETTALKRLMSRYASREDEIDDLLRNQVFVDLYAVVKQSLLIGEPSYSLKNVEHLYSFSRNGTVSTAGESIVRYHGWVVQRDGDDWRSSPTLNLAAFGLAPQQASRVWPCLCGTCSGTRTSKRYDCAFRTRETHALGHTAGQVIGTGTLACSRAACLPRRVSPARRKVAVVADLRACRNVRARAHR